MSCSGDFDEIDEIDEPSLSKVIKNEKDDESDDEQDDVRVVKESVTNTILKQEFCDYGTDTKTDLYKHGTVHGIVERYKCSQCDKDFKTTQILKMHIMHIHKEKTQGDIHKEKTFQCNQCSELFGTKDNLKRHKKAVHVLKSWQCIKCNKTYKSHGNLNKHIRSIHEKETFSCNLCDFVTNQRVHLKSHVESIHEKKKNWFCKICPFTCYQKCHFINHMRIHTGEKPFQCAICRARFTQMPHLERHQETMHQLYNKKCTQDLKHTKSEHQY